MAALQRFYELPFQHPKNDLPTQLLYFDRDQAVSQVLLSARQ